MAFDKTKIRVNYKLNKKEDALNHIRNMKNHQEQDITEELQDEYSDKLNKDLLQVLFHKTVRKKYVTVLWKDRFEVIDVTRAYSEVGPASIDECVSLFVDFQESIEDLTDLMD